MTNTDLVSRRERLLGTGTPLFYDDPVQIVRGESVWLYDETGRRYLDMYNNVPCVGHAHPHVVEAMQRQAETLNVHSRYLHEGILDYAERLTALHTDPISTAIFTCTGTEANEVAIQMARAATGNRGIIASDSAYHGNSTEVSKLSRLGSREARGLEPEPEYQSFPFPEQYRSLNDGASEQELLNLYLNEVRKAIAELQSRGVELAAMLLCPILANEGIPNIPTGFMAQATEIVHQAGGLVICDEVQAGFGRTGNWWGYETSDFLPDIVSLGKPMGNGMPLAGVVAPLELVNAFRQKARYFNTFAASPLQAAVGMAVIDVIEQEDLVQNAADIGEYMRDELRGMQEFCEPLAEVRGHGLFVGLEWVSDRHAKTADPQGADQVVNRLKEKGFLLSRAGIFGNVVKIRPPLPFQREHADLFLSAFEETIREPV
ncbi:MAG TPA: aspartate aminotransferase family protein [Dehalococcoidia bacterium]|nr:aspartate aminotransferase family protein [Dehalococcoidia bacterium]